MKNTHISAPTSKRIVDPLSLTLEVTKKRMPKNVRRPAFSAEFLSFLSAEPGKKPIHLSNQAGS